LMATMPKRQCPSCNRIVSGDCPVCTRKRRREYDNKRASSGKRGYDAKWQRKRDAKLRTDPLCECDDCKAGNKRVIRATMVHHIKPIETNPELRLKMSNLLSMSRECHEKLHKRF
jgi:5-methylcytosine-specific restriction protein A